MKKLSAQLVISVLLLTGCAASLPPADPQLSDKLQQEALQATALKQFQTASNKYNEAIQYNPLNGELYLQQAEILETIQNFEEAAKLYQLALKRLPAGQKELETIHYRLGLIQARTGKVKAARKSLAAVSEPWKKLDLEGMIVAQGDNPESSLELFQQALSKTTDYDEQARIYYHASLTHHKLGNIIESKNALFHAVNNASSLALKQHIRILFDQIR